MSEAEMDTAHGLAATLTEDLNRGLNRLNYDLLGIVPIPQARDRMVRLRTLEEALAEFDQSGISYLVHVRPQDPLEAADIAASDPELPASADRGTSVYLSDGKFNVPYLFQNAALLESSDEHELARNIYRALFQSGELPADALFAIARSFEKEGRFDEAKTHYSEAIAYQPTLQSYQALAGLMIRKGEDKEAAEILERALRIQSLSLEKKLELHKTCAHCWNRAQNPVAAEKHYSLALLLDHSNDDLRASLGAIYLRAGKMNEAKQSFQDAIAANPANARALTGLACCLLSQDDKRGAHDLFAKSLEADLANPTAIYYLVKLAFELKTYPTATRLLEAYTDTSAINAGLLYSLAGLQYHLGRFADARATALRVLEIEPNHAFAKDLIVLMNRFLS